MQPIDSVAMLRAWLSTACLWFVTLSPVIIAHNAFWVFCRLTSPSAMAIASTARKAQPAQQHSFMASSVADLLAVRLNDRCVTDPGGDSP
jgi:hypothetical protein